MKNYELISAKRVILSASLVSLALLAHSGAVTQAHIHLTESKMKLGLVLGTMNLNNYPYAQGGDINSRKIDVAADVTNEGIEGLIAGDDIHNTKMLRDYLGSIANSLRPVLFQGLNDEGKTWLEEARKSLIMSRMWLGQELGRIRESEEYKKQNAEDFTTSDVAEEKEAGKTNSKKESKESSNLAKEDTTNSDDNENTKTTNNIDVKEDAVGDTTLHAGDSEKNEPKNEDVEKLTTSKTKKTSQTK